MTEFDFEGGNKRGRGRPPGKGVKFADRVPADLKARVEAFAVEHFMTRAEALRELLERGLNGPKK